MRSKVLLLADHLRSSSCSSSRGGGSGGIDVDEAFLRLTLDVMGSTGFGYEFNALQFGNIPFLQVSGGVRGKAFC